jgi:hypothetical protein
VCAVESAVEAREVALLLVKFTLFTTHYIYEYLKSMQTLCVNEVHRSNATLKGGTCKCSCAEFHELLVLIKRKEFAVKRVWKMLAYNISNFIPD